MLEIAADKNFDWHDAWKGSAEAQEIQHSIDRLHQEKSDTAATDDDPSAHSEFAMPFTSQLSEVTKRVFQQ
jgi:ATP-binding cassette, subfamily G (WHITE), member 2, PDR